MSRRSSTFFATLVLALSLPAAAFAGARLVSIIPTDGGCVNGPTGLTDEDWYVAPGHSYIARVDMVNDAAHGGSDGMMPVLLRTSSLGNVFTGAVRVAPGVYEFNFALSSSDCMNTTIRYGVAPGLPSSGFVAGRHDTGWSTSHVHAATFQPGCSGAVEVPCTAGTAVLEGSWGSLKSVYR